MPEHASEHAATPSAHTGRAADVATPGATSAPTGAADKVPLPFITEVGREEMLRLEHVTKHFPTGGGIFREKQVVRAVEDVSLNLLKGETIGLVGESGCGKSTLGRMVLRLLTPTSGTINVDGIDVRDASGRDLRQLRQRIQIVFQDPFASLDPRRTVRSTISEPLLAAGVERSERDAIVAALMKRMGLDPSLGGRYPHQFSGGQRQRIGVARAMSVKPKVLVLDEPTSALDVSIQAQVLKMLRELRDEYDLSYLLISHDLSVVRHVSDRLAVMYLGRLVEIGDRREVFSEPAHPYTKALLSAAPIPDPIAERGRERIVLPGDVPNPANPPTGCAFHPRCFLARELAKDMSAFDTIQVGDEQVPARCVTELPTMLPLAGTQRWTACHFPLHGTLAEPVAAAGTATP